MRALLCISLLLVPACGGEEATTGLLTQSEGPFVRDTGGVLPPEQACYDVQHYDLSMQVFPDQREIAATLRLDLVMTAESDRVLLNLDPMLTVVKVFDIEGMPMKWQHEQDKLMVAFLGPSKPNENHSIFVRYSGKPRTAPRAPWEGGFQWEQTPSGEHWIATSCQMEGADLWWPCKDHPSDKPDSFGLHFRVPSDLVAVSNGKLDRIEDHMDGTITFHWKVSTPIPNYSIALNLGPYEKLEAKYTSVAGMSLPVQFWVLPESLEPAREILPEFVDHLRWFEETLGPYPFRADKYGVVQTPHLGMEHQTIIGYGNEFQEHQFNYDWLHHHELSHEWFANLVTAPDWNDFWIHEGFGSYTQKLYIEQRDGFEAYRNYLATVRGRINNAKAVAPREPRTSAQMYFLDANAPEGEKPSDSDIYFKGEWVLHTLRYVIGEDALMRSFRKMCYPSPYSRDDDSGGAVHFFTTDDYLKLVEDETNMQLDWFFDLYLRQPELPELIVERVENVYHFKWKTPNDMPCYVPVEVVIGGLPKKLDMPKDGHELTIPAGTELIVDPFDRVLRKHNHCLDG